MKFETSKHVYVLLIKNKIILFFQSFTTILNRPYSVPSPKEILSDPPVPQYHVTLCYPYHGYHGYHYLHYLYHLCL